MVHNTGTVYAANVNDTGLVIHVTHASGSVRIDGPWQESNIGETIYVRNRRGTDLTVTAGANVTFRGYAKIGNNETLALTLNEVGGSSVFDLTGGKQ
jgi:hypothetical protein